MNLSGYVNIACNVPKSFISIILDWYRGMARCLSQLNGTVLFLLLANCSRMSDKVVCYRPLFFNVYVNDILINLQQRASGCHVSGKYVHVGALMYGDDLLLISITLQDVR